MRGGTFRTPAEQAEFSLVSELATWCITPPKEERDLVELQQHVRAIQDLDRRSGLMAAIASAWLDQDDFERARAIADVATADGLEAAGYFSRLATLYQTTSDHRVGIARELTLEAVTRSPEVKRDAARDILAAWFGLRARADSRERPQHAWFNPECLRRIINSS